MQSVFTEYKKSLRFRSGTTRKVKPENGTVQAFSDPVELQDIIDAAQRLKKKGDANWH